MIWSIEHKMNFFLVLLIACAVSAKARPYEFGEAQPGVSDPSSNPKCYHLFCPPRTVGCSKTVKTTDDRRTIVTTIQCEDVDGVVLLSEPSAEPNPNVNTIVQSHSFSGTYNFNGGGQVTRHFGVHNNYNNDQIETF